MTDSAERMTPRLLDGFGFFDGCDYCISELESAIKMAASGEKLRPNGQIKYGEPSDKRLGFLSGEQLVDRAFAITGMLALRIVAFDEREP